MVIVEGKTDKRIYWWVRDRFGTGNARVFDARGIDELLNIYNQKTTLFDARGVAIALWLTEILNVCFVRTLSLEILFGQKGTALRMIYTRDM